MTGSTANQDGYIGKRLGRYEIDSLLAKGGMGLVYRGHDTTRDKKVAIKILSEDSLRNEQMVRRFERESGIVQKIQHVNVAQIFKTGLDEGIPYYIMEYVDGQSMSELLSTKGKIGGRCSIDYLRQTVLGLREAAKYGVIHRDIKPANLMLSNDGTIKIVDFGIAKAMTNDSFQTATGQVMGTAMYISPEQARGEEVDLRSDVYSLGATFYHILTGKPPFDEDNPVRVMMLQIQEYYQPVYEVNPKVPPKLCNIIHQMTEKDPNERYQDYDALILAIDGIYSTKADDSTLRFGGTSPASSDYGRSPQTSEYITHNTDTSESHPIPGGYNLGPAQNQPAAQSAPLRPPLRLGKVLMRVLGIFVLLVIIFLGFVFGPELVDLVTGPDPDDYEHLEQQKRLEEEALEQRIREISE